MSDSIKGVSKAVKSPLRVNPREENAPIFGGMAGFKMVSLSRIKSPIAGGLSIGTASHAVGTAAAIEIAHGVYAVGHKGLTVTI